MTKEEIEQAAIERYGNDIHLFAKQRDGFQEGAKWAFALQSENERLKAELLGNPEQLKAESKLTEYKLLAGEACFETLSKVNDAWPDVADREWISVEDRLPEYKQQVLVYTKLKSTVRGIYHNRKWDIDFRIVDMSYVTHWMPLPQPPKQ